MSNLALGPQEEEWRRSLMDCSDQRCNGHGDCVTVKRLPACECMLGYTGDACKYTVNGGLSAPLTLGVLGVLLVIIVLAFLIAYFRQKRKARIRGNTAEAKKGLKINGDSDFYPNIKKARNISRV